MPSSRGTQSVARIQIVKQEDMIAVMKSNGNVQFVKSNVPTVLAMCNKLVVILKVPFTPTVGTHTEDVNAAIDCTKAELADGCPPKEPVVCAEATDMFALSGKEKFATPRSGSRSVSNASTSSASTRNAPHVPILQEIVKYEAPQIWRIAGITLVR